MPAGATYEPIATTTLTSVSAITFSSIPSTYTDLRLVLVGRNERASTSTNVAMRFNSDTGTNYSHTFIDGNGTTASSGRGTSATNISLYFTPGTTVASGIFSLITVDIFSYAGSTYKTTLGTNSFDLNGSGNVRDIVGLWRSTSAITQIDLTVTNNFSIGTTATLYGIKAA